MGQAWDHRSGSMPAPVLYPGHRSLRNDSITWSVATPTWVAPSPSSWSTEPTTPLTAATSCPAALRCGGAPK